MGKQSKHGVKNFERERLIEERTLRDERNGRLLGMEMVAARPL